MTVGSRDDVARASTASDAPARPDRDRLWLILIILGFVAAIAVFARNLAGDAQVHLVIAERFAAGDPFTYNAGGPIVNATTSPFWTIMLTGFYEIAGDLAPLLLKIVTVAVYGFTGWLVWRVAGTWKLSNALRYLAVACYLIGPWVALNAMGGLENVLAGTQILLLLLLMARPGAVDLKRSVLVGLLLGWIALTRLDIAVFAGVLVLMAILLPRPGVTAADDGDTEASPSREPWKPVIVALAVMGVAALVVMLPWFIFQYAETGKILSDSMQARINEGRLSGITIIPGLYTWHAQDLLHVFVGWLPISIGVTVSCWQSLRVLVRNRPALADSAVFSRAVAVVPFLLGFIAYQGLAGLTHFHRYFLAFYPLFFLFGAHGAGVTYRWLRARRISWGKWFLWGGAVWLVVVNLSFLASFAVSDGAFQLALPHVLEARDKRTEWTTDTLAALGEGPDSEVKVAVREVQARYFWDDRIDVASLDGRSSRSGLEVYKKSGPPDFAAFFEAEKPDYVVIGSWCYYNRGFLASGAQGNLLCDWEKKAAEVGPGSSFEWNGHRVETLECGPPDIPAQVEYTTFRKCTADGDPAMVRIDWD